MTAAAKTELAGHWTHVTEASGQPFADGGMAAIRPSSTTPIPAARAVVVARRSGMNLALRFLHDAQRAFYAEGRDITRPETLAEIAESNRTRDTERVRSPSSTTEDGQGQETWKRLRHLPRRGA